MIESNNMIALYEINDIDRDVITQLLSQHPDRIGVKNIHDLDELKSDLYSLCLSYRIVDVTIPLIILSNSRIRVGRLIDDIEMILLQNRYGDTSYKGYELNWGLSRLSFHDQEVSLTERERYLIAEILNGGDKGRSRDYLLKKIWGYRSDLETHTLETHIYRLRQKIEAEPDLPQRLITIENGYKLA